MQKVIPCLWFNYNAEEAVNFYVGLIPNSKINRICKSPNDNPSVKQGEVLTVEFTLGGIQYLALNGGPQYPFTEAVSFQIMCEDQAEVDRYWEALTEGGTEVACSWLKDRWGLSWQIVPIRLMELLNDPDRARAKRAMDAMMNMVKIDIAAVEQAAHGSAG